MGRPASQLPRITFRLPEKLLQRLEDATRTNGTSMNAEIVERLDMSFIHEVEGRESDNRSLRNEVMELRYSLVHLVGALLANDKHGFKEEVEEVLLKYKKEMEEIELKGEDAYAQRTGKDDLAGMKPAD